MSLDQDKPSLDTVNVNNLFDQIAQGQQDILSALRLLVPAKPLTIVRFEDASVPANGGAAFQMDMTENKQIGSIFVDFPVATGGAGNVNIYAGTNPGGTPLLTVAHGTFKRMPINAYNLKTIMVQFPAAQANSTMIRVIITTQVWSPMMGTSV